MKELNAELKLKKRKEAGLPAPEHQAAESGVAPHGCAQGGGAIL